MLVLGTKDSKKRNILVDDKKREENYWLVGLDVTISLDIETDGSIKMVTT